MNKAQVAEAQKWLADSLREQAELARKTAARWRARKPEYTVPFQQTIEELAAAYDDAAQAFERRARKEQG